MSKIIAVSTGKGGGAKSTTAWHIGVALTTRGQQVLLVDLDDQQHLTNWISQTYEDERTGWLTTSELIYQQVSGVSLGTPDHFIRRSSNDDIDYIPANKMMAGSLNNLGQDIDSYTILHNIFKAPYFEKNYDYIILDCPPAFNLLVTNAFRCADKVLIPVEAKKACYDTVLGIVEKIAGAKGTAEVEPFIQGFLVSKYEMNKNICKDVYNAIVQSYGDLAFKTPIPYLNEVELCCDSGKSVVYSEKSRAGQAFTESAERILQDNQ